MTVSPDTPVVAVLLGTDHHRFDRLVSWVHELAMDSPRLHWFVQHGSTPLPAGLSGTPLMGASELEGLLARASAVVTHGGPGLVMESRAHGHRPVVVARDPRRGEHVDDHQQLFAARLAAHDLCALADTRTSLGAAVDTAVADGTGDDPVPAGVSDLPRQVGDLVDALVSAQRRGARARVGAWRR